MAAAADALGLDVRFRERPAARSLEEAADLLGTEPADVVKSLVVRLPDRTHLFVLVDGTSSIAWPRLRALLGVNKMSMPSAADALAATRYERGTITPLGSEPSWPVVVDARLRGRTVAMGAGVHGWSAFVVVDAGARTRRDRGRRGRPRRLNLVASCCGSPLPWWLHRPQRCTRV